MNMDASSTETASSTPENSVGLDFLHVRINQDNASGRFGRKVHTRFPPDGLMACFHSVTTLLPGRKHGRGRKSWKNRGRGEGNFLKKVSLSPPPYPLLSPFKDFRLYRIPVRRIPCLPCRQFRKIRSFWYGSVPTA